MTQVASYDISDVRVDVSRRVDVMQRHAVSWTSRLSFSGFNREATICTVTPSRVSIMFSYNPMALRKLG